MLPSDPGAVGSLSLALFHRWEPERIFVLLTIYCDESGTHAGAPAMILGGYVATVRQWHVFEKRWAKLLRSSHLTYHHSAEMMNQRGEYRRWKQDRISTYIEETIRLAEQDTYAGFTIKLGHDDYEKHYVAGERPKKIQLDTKYGVCFRLMLSFIPSFMQRSLGRDNLQIHIVLESGAPGMGDTYRLFDLFKKHAPPEIARLVESVTIGDKKKMAGLQAADSLAYAAYQVDKHKSIGLLDFMPTGTLDQAKQTTGMRSPVLHLPATEEVLHELKDNIISQIALRKMLGERRPKPIEASVLPAVDGEAQPV